MKGTVKFAMEMALVGLCLMIFFLATGAASPDASSHPRWYLDFTHTLPGMIVAAILLASCLPAFLLAAVIATPLRLAFASVFWLIASVVQVTLYFGVSLALAELSAYLRRRTGK